MNEERVFLFLYKILFFNYFILINLVDKIKFITFIV